MYRATMYARDRIGKEYAVNRSMALLDDMEDLWKAGNGDVRPYWAAYNSALKELS